jgi:hypothetical protein
MTSLLQRVDAGQAKGEFFFFFFGGSGALGIGFSQVPRLLAEFKDIAALGGQKSLGGADIACFPLSTIGYPEPLREKDIQQIINNAPSISLMLQKGPKKSYMAQVGYLEREGFVASFPNSNPLAVYAAYSALSKGGGDLAAPQEVDSMIKKWKAEGLEAFKQDLLAASLRKYSAYIVFGMLIALVIDLIIESGANAFL